jgi:DNA-binding NtrC family response regulator
MTSDLDRDLAEVLASHFPPDRSYRDTRSDFETQFERRYVKWLLDRHSGNISAAAREAQMDRKHLYYLARKHGMRDGRR